MDTLYSNFVQTDSFSTAVEAIEFDSVRDAVFRHGIGDDLGQSENGSFFYHYEAGNLIEPEVKEALVLLSEKQYRLAYGDICNVAEAYAEWANLLELEQTLA